MAYIDRISVVHVRFRLLVKVQIYDKYCKFAQSYLIIPLHDFLYLSWAYLEHQTLHHSNFDLELHEFRQRPFRKSNSYNFAVYRVSRRRPLLATLYSVNQIPTTYPDCIDDFLWSYNTGLKYAYL